ncbi:sensor histidine kinase [Halosolutus gelatinilyticus]|uniref:sensor histidine kinase n=1 Tax=Halosolutus gelatinilyticus TaxID=2931975 RepID=UPI002AB294C4|nr:ATP-binding protein [Halosolutus gelatinilyticus]
MIAICETAYSVVIGQPLLDASVDFLLISLPGALFLYVGGWLGDTDIEPDLYVRIVSWSLAGVGVMFTFLLLRAIHPAPEYSFSWTTRAVALSIGSVAGLAIGIHDARAITRERELDRRNEELRRIRADLENAVIELEASNERLDSFASTASHDLQEPLRMISQYLQLIDDRYAADLDEDGREFLAFAVDGADRMRAMVDDLLAYSRVDSQGEPLGPVDLNAVLDDVQRDLQVSIEEHNAEIVAEELPCVRGDAGQLRQVFQNLLSNAIEYSGDAPPRITVSARRRADEWVLSVTDEGIGIEPDDQRRIFDLFQRLHAIDDHAGSGIGLALCKRIVERHGGEIWVESEPGDGSTFSFTVSSCPEQSTPAQKTPSG